MAEGELWTLIVFSSPLISGVVALLLAERGFGRWRCIALSLVTSVAYLLIANLFVGRPEEWALVFVLSIVWWPIMIGGAFVGYAFGKGSS